jgi:TolB-like protein/class 3 adenylate cyclase
MADTHPERRLAAILAADVVGYARLIEQDEAATLAALRELRQRVIDPLLAEHKGRIVKLMGDGALVEFASVVDAVACAVAVQQAEVPPKRRIVFRIGINLGDVVVEGEDLLGDGVNIAARLEQLCEPGGVLISGTAYDHLQGRLGLPIEDAGEQRVKNIERPVRAYRVRLDGTAARFNLRRLPRFGRRTAAAAIILFLLVAAAGGWWWRVSEPTDPPLPDKPSIAVLPFTNMSGDPTQEYFSDGITEDIITALAQSEGLFVIARNSSFAYKGKTVDVRQVGRELGVRYVLEGSVQRSGKRLRITAQLIDAFIGAHTWTERWDREMSDLFAVQDEIARKIAGSIGAIGAGHGVLREAELGRVGQLSDDELRAYDLFLRGITAVDTFSKEGNERGRSLLEQAVALDLRYGRAWGKLAWTHIIDFNARWSADPVASLEKGIATAEAGVRADPSSAWPQWSLGAALSFKGRLAEAREAYERAITLNPNDADVICDYGWLLAYLGEPQVGQKHIAEAMRLNPRYPDWYLFNLGQVSYLAGDYEGAIRALVRASPDFPPVRVFMAASHAMLGRDAEARAEIAAALKLNPTLTLANADDGGGPFRPEDLERFLAALRRAGLPDPPSTQ